MKPQILRRLTGMFMLKVLTWVPNIQYMRSRNSLLKMFFAGCCMLLLSACANEKDLIEVAEMATEDQLETVEEPVQITQEVAPPVLEGPRKVVGEFRSVRGVMDPLSCYCGNGGYVESPAGESVAVCFNDNENVQSTDYIFIEGVMITRTIESNGACPAGTMSYLIVESYSLQP